MTQRTSTPYNTLVELLSEAIEFLELYEVRTAKDKRAFIKRADKAIKNSSNVSQSTER